MSVGQKVSVLGLLAARPTAPCRAGRALADTIYEDLQSCYGIYASLFHRWGQGSPLLTLRPAP